MDVVHFPIADLKPDPHNAKRHPRRQIESIKDSLRRFGQQKPIVVDADGVIVAGNGTAEAAKELGWTQIAIVRTELRGNEARAFALADNRLSELGEWDLEILAEQLTAPDIGDVGFSEADLLAMIGTAGVGMPDTEASTTTTTETVTVQQEPDDGNPQRAGKPIKLTVEQREGADEVFERFRKKHQTPGDQYKLSEGQIATLIFADWAAGN